MFGSIGSIMPSYPPEPLPREPIKAGEFIGHRIWEVHASVGKPDDFMLRSYIMNVFWHPFTPMSDTAMEGCQIGERNEVGVWSFKTHKTLIEEYVPQFYSPVLPYIIGTAWLWGTIIEHQDGYRSQYAAIRTLDLIYCGEYGPTEYGNNLLEKARALYLKK